MNYDFHLRMVFSSLKLNRDNLVSLFVNAPCDRSTVLPNVISILETFQVHQEELKTIKNCNFSLKIPKSYLNEYEEIKELISAFCKDNSKSQPDSPKKSVSKRQYSTVRKNLSQSVEIMELPPLDGSRYNLSHLLPNKKRFAKAVSDQSSKNSNSRAFPASKGPTLKRPLGVFSQMRKRALINDFPGQGNSEQDLSQANRSMLRRVLKGMEGSSQKTRDLMFGQSKGTSQKSLTVKQTYSERKFNDFLARHRRSNRESEISFDQSTRFTKKAKKSFCFKTIHSKFTSGFEKKIKKTFSLRSLHTQALRPEPKEPSFVPLDMINLNDLTSSFVQRESDRRKSFITVPHENVNKHLMSITQESNLSDSEKSVQSLQTRPYRRRRSQQHCRSEEDFGFDSNNEKDTVFLRDLEMLKELDEEVYLNYMQQHLDYYEFLDGKESLAIIGHDFSKKEHNIDKINLKYRRNEHYYLPKPVKIVKKPIVKSRKSDRNLDNTTTKTQKNGVLKPKPRLDSVKAVTPPVKNNSLVSSKKKKKRQRNKKKESKIKAKVLKYPEEKKIPQTCPPKNPVQPLEPVIQEILEKQEVPSLKISYPIGCPQDNKPMINSNVNTLSWMLKDSDTKLGSLVKDNSEKEIGLFGLMKQHKGKFVESQKVVITEGISSSKKLELKVSVPLEPQKKREEENVNAKQKKKRRKRKKKDKKKNEQINQKLAQKISPDLKTKTLNFSSIKNEQFESDLFLPKIQESGLLTVNNPKNNLLSSSENFIEKNPPFEISEKKINQLDLLSEKSETEKIDEPKQKPGKVGEKKKRKRKRKKKKRKKKNNNSKAVIQNPVVEELPAPKTNEKESSLKLISKDFLTEKPDKKILEFVSEFDQLSEHSQSEKMKVLRRGIEEFSKGRPTSPETDKMYNRLNTDEKLLSLLALSKDNEDQKKRKTEHLVQLMGDFEEFSETFHSKSDLETGQNPFFTGNQTKPENLRGKLQGKKRFSEMGELETEKKSMILEEPFFEQEDLDCGLLSQLMDEIEERQKFHHVGHFYIEKSYKENKIVIIDPDLH